MSFNWADFLKLARELAERTDEAALRSAVSRAYYSVLGSARALFDARGEVSAMVSADTLWKTLQGKGDDARRQIGVAGSRLRTKRNRADYDAVVSGLAKLAKASLLEAEGLMALLARL